MRLRCGPTAGSQCPLINEGVNTASTRPFHQDQNQSLHTFGRTPGVGATTARPVGWHKTHPGVVEDELRVHGVDDVSLTDDIDTSSGINNTEEI